MENTFVEISENELLDVEGGNPILGAAATAGTIWVCYEIGYAAGKAICHLTSGKKKKKK